MTRRRAGFGTAAALALICSLVLDGCGDAGKTPLSPTDAGARFAKTSSTTVSVKATDPAFGDQGQTSLAVTITGSGFKDGARADWLYNGAVDPTISVSSPHVVNSTTMTAVINIAPNSPLDFRDVLVTNTDRTHGIGAAVFEVTQAQIIPGTKAARGVNDNGEAVGSLTNGGTFYYDISTGLLQTVSTAGTGYDISPQGNAIVGDDGTRPILYTRAGPVGTAWSATALPIEAAATGGSATAIVTDPVTGLVTMLGGSETFPQSHGCAVSTPVIWTWQASSLTWQLTVLPKNGACQANVWPRGLSRNGTAVGRANPYATVWTPDGSGGYTITQLEKGYGYGIDGAASMIVGAKNLNTSTLTAVYWTRSAGGWSSAIQFAGGCDQSRDVADVSGRVTLNDCPFGSSSVAYAAYMDPPYTTPVKLGGVGGHNNNFIGGISPSGQYMVGNGYTSGNVQVGVYWRP
jgi:hypothetical protein